MIFKFSKITQQINSDRWNLSYEYLRENLFPKIHFSFKSQIYILFDTSNRSNILYMLLYDIVFVRSCTIIHNKQSNDVTREAETETQETRVIRPKSSSNSILVCTSNGHIFSACVYVYRDIITNIHAKRTYTYKYRAPRLRIYYLRLYSNLQIL